MSIWITGDCHARFGKLNRKSFLDNASEREVTKDDYVIICGDFGGIWHQENSPYIKEENYWLDWLNDAPFTVLFIDGNHENFDRLNSFPVEEWMGGKVHKIRPSVIHLMRGEIYTIDSKKVFAFGGASSHDIQDGILIPDKDGMWKKEADRLESQGKYMFRIKGLSWWEQELPTDEEMENGIRNLEKHNWEVDYIITHTPPASTIALLGNGCYEQDRLTKYLEDIKNKTTYKKMFSGHMHEDSRISDKDVLIYNQIIKAK